MDRGAWWATVCGVTKRHNWATNTFTFKEARDLHSENYKILWKKSKVKQIDGEIPMFLDWKKQYCENGYTTQSNLEIWCKFYQITNGIFHRIGTKKTYNMCGNTSWSSSALTHWKRQDPDAGKDGRQEEKGATEDEMVGWHHQLHGHRFEQTLGDSEGQGSLACCGPWGHKELTQLSDWTATTNGNTNDPE